jgi:hypothetical protein
MYDVTLQSPDRFAFEDLGEALLKALFSAMEGRPAAVHENGELLWEIEADTKGSPCDPYHSAIVHFRRLEEDCDHQIPWKHAYNLALDESAPTPEAPPLEEI